MDSSLSPKEEIWFLPMWHYISNAVYHIGPRQHVCCECMWVSFHPLYLWNQQMNFYESWLQHATRRCRNRSFDLIDGGRWWWRWWCLWWLWLQNVIWGYGTYPKFPPWRRKPTATSRHLATSFPLDGPHVEVWHTSVKWLQVYTYCYWLYGKVLSASWN